VNPRLASARVDPSVDGEHASPESRRWGWFAALLFAGGLGAGLALLASGQRITAGAAFVLLAALLALAVNRYAFFPTELAVTAEVAVLLAAVVWFGLPAAAGGGGGTDGSELGPWLLALLAGPLDVLHWRQRAYLRMAYNAGNRMAATLLAAVVFSAVLGADPSPPNVTIAVGGLAAAATFAGVEIVIGTVLARLRTSGAWAAAARVELPMEILTIPLGVAGALAGYLGATEAWWIAPLILAPTVVVPELMVVARRPRRSHVAFVAMVGVAATVVALSVALAPWPGPAEVAGLAVVALLLGVELRASARAPVPSLVALGVAAALVVGRGAQVGTSVAVAVVATTVTWGLERASRWWAVLLAAAAAVGADLVFDLRPSRAMALLAAVVFQLAVWTNVERVVWTAPLLGVGVASAFAWRAVGGGGGAVFVIALVVVLAAVSAVGAPPWNSRVLAACVARVRRGAHRAFIVGAAFGALASAAVGLAARSTSAVLVPVASAGAAAVAAVAMNAVRQWRFAPMRRFADAAGVLVSAMAVVVLYPTGGLDGQAWAFVLLVVAIAVCSAIAWPLAGRAATAATGPAGDRAGRVEQPGVSARPGSSDPGTPRSRPRA
jgi:hypothetical protein